MAQIRIVILLMLMLLLAYSSTVASAAIVWGPGDSDVTYWVTDSGLAIGIWGCDFTNATIYVKAGDSNYPAFIEVREYQTLDYNSQYNVLGSVSHSDWTSYATVAQGINMSRNMYYVIVIHGIDQNGNPDINTNTRLPVYGYDAWPNATLYRIIDVNGDGNLDFYDTGQEGVFLIQADTVSCDYQINVNILNITIAKGTVDVWFEVTGIPAGSTFYAWVESDPDGDGVYERSGEISVYTSSGTKHRDLYSTIELVAPWRLVIEYQKNSFYSEPKYESYSSGLGITKMASLILSVAPSIVSSVQVLAPYISGIWAIWLVTSIVRSIEKTSIEPIVDFFYKNFNLLVQIFNVVRIAIEFTATLGRRLVDIILKIIDIII